VEGSSHAKNQLDSFSRSDRTPTCDGQTQAHGYYRGCVASLGKNNKNKQNVNKNNVEYILRLHLGLVNIT